MVNYEKLMGLIIDLCGEQPWSNSFGSTSMDKDGIVETHTLRYKENNIVARFNHREGGDIMSIMLIGGEKKHHGGFEYGKNNHMITMHPSPTKYVIEYKSSIEPKPKYITYEADNGRFMKYQDFDGNYWDHEMGMDFHFSKPVENVADLIRGIVYGNRKE